MEALIMPIFLGAPKTG